MKQLPHHYAVNASANPADSVAISATGLPTLKLAPPRQFDGPGDQWSPEDLLMASVSSCMVLSFKAIARTSKFEWSSIGVTANGKLDKSTDAIKFTEIHLQAMLTIPSEENFEKAGKLLEKAKATCFISNTLNCELSLDYKVSTL